jgi:hypothetical protein
LFLSEALKSATPDNDAPNVSQPQAAPPAPERSAASGNETSNPQRPSKSALEDFELDGSVVLSTFETLFECEMTDDFRGMIYMLRQHVKDLIESGRSLPSAPIGSELLPSPAPDWKNQNDQFRSALSDLDNTLTDAFGMIHLVAERLIWEVNDSSLQNAGCVAAGISFLWCVTWKAVCIRRAANCGRIGKC